MSSSWESESLALLYGHGSCNRAPLHTGKPEHSTGGDTQARILCQFRHGNGGSGSETQPGRYARAQRLARPRQNLTLTKISCKRWAAETPWPRCLNFTDSDTVTRDAGPACKARKGALPHSIDTVSAAASRLRTVRDSDIIHHKHFADRARNNG